MAEMTREEMQALILQQKEMIEKLAAAAMKKQTISLKVSEKGALSAYGIGRWPLTLYRSQWEAVLGKADDIRAFIKANDHLLKAKPTA